MAGKFLELKGLVLVLVLALLVWLSVAIYQKKFSDSVDVTVTTERAGLQLNANADVRMRGALVGRVTDIDQRDGKAIIEIALDTDAATRIPAQVVARILPTTLFGEKYVELVAPDGPSARSIAAGARIAEDESVEAVEITTALDNLQPVLTAVRPQDLASTLQAVAGGLEGRGEQLGRTVEDTNRLLGRLQRHLPLLVEDLKLLANVTNAYADAAPDVLRILGNTTFTANTVLDQKAVLATFYSDVTGLSDTLRTFLDRNEDGIVEVNHLSRPVLALLARYSPQLPCVLRGLIASNKAFNSAFYNGKLNSFAVLGLQQPAYAATDQPDWSAASPGPTCAGLPAIPGGFTMPRFTDGGAHHPGAVIVP